MLGWEAPFSGYHPFQDQLGRRVSLREHYAQITSYSERAIGAWWDSTGELWGRPPSEPRSTDMIIIPAGNADTLMILTSRL